MAEPSAGGPRRLRLDVAYDGGAFSGWARQPSRSTVQGALEGALSRVLRQPADLTVAGRTDAGVHATGQVCHLDVVPAVVGAMDLPDLARRVNGVLDSAVRVLSVGWAPPGFDARFSALSRRYEYRVADAPYGVLPLRRHDTAAHPRPLSLPRLRAASRPLVGLHDFAAFCRRRDGATTVRTLTRLTWTRGADGVLVAVMEADAFCHQMVRSLVGTLLLAGDGRRDVDWAERVLSGADRAAAGAVAPPHGLTLVAVRYPADSRLAARAVQTRRRRDG
ncbi:MAG TPA: tRNA pseudouridine(38-40) synthase TruA [Mycobacteriales bacterium]|nr:tRNA pseudouridine(38-40) synthase TruA [Mycobacteriales bacterium]